VRCSPDADDLFMMRALSEGLIDPGPWRFVVETAPTDALNRIASAGGADVCAISIAHYPHVAKDWQLLPHGGSLGEGYGPVVVAPQRTSLRALAGQKVAVPGLTTTAWTALRMHVDVEPVVIPITPYARVFEALRGGEVAAALIIHEGRLTYTAEGFEEVADLGERWGHETGLPLPLGGNAIRRALGAEAIASISERLRASIRHALDHRDEAIDWLLARGGALRDRESMDRYLAMYANERSYDYGDEGRAGVRVFLDRAASMELLPRATVDFAP
jgi:1,4-dihydroxy-6-naphthoate synthase